MIQILHDYPIRKWTRAEWPIGLSEIPQPPKELHIRGTLPTDMKFLCIVGPRKYTEYGKMVCEKLISGLSGYPICIVSGLAYGMDSIAHRTAIEHKMVTVAFPGSGLNESVIYPQSHIHLAREIIESGGAIISEFANNFAVHNWMFPQRNRLLAGIADAVLIIEAREKSGTAITARLAIEYNRELCVVPGSIFHENSSATNRLIKSGARVITSSEDILDALHISPEQKSLQLNILDDDENLILTHLKNPQNIDDLCRATHLPMSTVNATISKLELKNIIKVINGKICQK